MSAEGRSIPGRVPVTDRRRSSSDRGPGPAAEIHWGTVSPRRTASRRCSVARRCPPQSFRSKYPRRVDPPAGAKDRQTFMTHEKSGSAPATGGDRGRVWASGGVKGRGIIPEPQPNPSADRPTVAVIRAGGVNELPLGVPWSRRTLGHGRTEGVPIAEMHERRPISVAHVRPPDAASRSRTVRVGPAATAGPAASA